MLRTVGNVVRRQNSAFLTRITRPLAHVAQDVPAPTSSGKENASIVGSKPRSLGLDISSPLRVTDPPPTGLSGVALKLLGFYSRESQLIRGSRTLYARITSHADTPELYANFGLQRSFRTTHAVLLVHVWLTLVRLRAEGKEGSKVGQSLYELFNHDLEKRIVEEGVKMLISKWMKQLERNFYGAVEAYDAAMQPSADKDALARALWRNVFAEDDSPMATGIEAAPVKSDLQAFSAEGAGSLYRLPVPGSVCGSFARYVRREAACLAMTDSESLLTGNIEFSHDFGALSSTNSASSEQGFSEPVPA